LTTVDNQIAAQEHQIVFRKAAMHTDLKYPQWQAPLYAAILELDLRKLSEKLRLAEAAISNRADELAFEQTSHEERRALADGLYVVRMLRKDRLQ
jgi:hypothetical protein